MENNKVKRFKQFVEDNKINETFKSHIEYKTDTIIKTFSDNYELGLTIKYFPNHPELFPFVYNIDGNVIELEKLETKKAVKEFNLLNKWFKKNLKMSFGSFLMRDYTFKHIYPNRTYPILSTDFPLEYKLILDKYQKLINDIMDVVGKYFLLDVHSLNFGYDKNGNLKMVDI